MNFIKKSSLLLSLMLICNFSLPLLAVSRDVQTMQTYAVMGLGTGTSIAGLAALYSLLKASSKEQKEMPFNKKDYLLVRMIKSTGSLALGLVKVGAALTLTVGGGAMVLCSPAIVDAFNN